MSVSPRQGVGGPVPLNGLDGVGSSHDELRREMEVLHALSASARTGEGDLTTTLREISRAAAQCLDVQFASIWLLGINRSQVELIEHGVPTEADGPWGDDESRMTCVERFDLKTGEHAAGGELIVDDCQEYLAAIAKERTLAVRDSVHDPRTRELAAACKHAERGVAATLDAAIRIDGRTVGIVCHEHAGMPREWTAAERSFAASIADHVALAIESSRRKQAEDRLRRLQDAIDARVLERTATLALAMEQLEEQAAQSAQGEQRVRHTLAELQAVFNVFPDLYLRFSSDVRILDFSGDASILNLAYEEILGNPVRDVFPAAAAEQIVPAISRVVSTRVPDRIAYSVRSPDGTRHFDARLVPFRDDQVISVVRDVTEREQAGDELRRQTSLLQSILDGMSDGVVVADGQGRLVLFNPAAHAILGLEESDVGTQSWSRRCEVYRPDGKTPYSEDELPLVKSIAGVRTDNVEVLCGAHGTDRKRWLCANGRPLMDEQGRSLGGVVAFRDITEEKTVRDALLADQRFMERLLMAHEHDRRLMAYEIHDGLVQDVTGALMHLEAYLTCQTPAEGRAADEFSRALALMRESVDEARGLINGLRPPIIDDSGVVAAIDYLIGVKKLANDEPIEFVHSVQVDRLAPLLEGALFRIVQEGLTNIRRHSDATKARVTLTQAGDRIHLEIKDWGVGFDPDAIDDDRFGLQGIRERARLLRGTATIESTPGKGTRIFVDLPAAPALSPGSTRSVE